MQTGSGHRNRKWPSGTSRFKPDVRDSVTSTSLKRKFRNLGTMGNITNPSANPNPLNSALDNDQDDLPLSDLTKMAKILSSVPALRLVFLWVSLSMDWWSPLRLKGWNFCHIIWLIWYDSYGSFDMIHTAHMIWFIWAEDFQHKWKLSSSLKRKVSKSIAIQTEEEPKSLPEKEFWLRIP